MIPSSARQTRQQRLVLVPRPRLASRAVFVRVGRRFGFVIRNHGKNFLDFPMSHIKNKKKYVTKELSGCDVCGGANKNFGYLCFRKSIEDWPRLNQSRRVLSANFVTPQGCVIMLWKQNRWVSYGLIKNMLFHEFCNNSGVRKIQEFGRTYQKHM